MNSRYEVASRFRRPAFGGLHLSGERVTLALRLAWMGTVGLVLFLFIGGIPVILSQLQTTCRGSACQNWQLEPGDLTKLHALGLSTHFWSVSFVALDALMLLAFCGVATVLFWRQAGDRMGAFCAFMLIGTGPSFSQTIRAVGSKSAQWSVPVHLLMFLSLTTLIVFFYLFPDGRFVPRWTRWLTLGCVMLSAAIAFAPWNSIPQGVGVPLLCVGVAGLLGSAVVAQVYRYRRVSTLTQRLQTRWPVAGFAMTIILFAALAILFSIDIGRPTSLPPVLHNASFLLLAYNAWRFPFVLIPASIGVAILRYRLFDIDAIINRALVYGGLTASVIAFYALVVGYLSALFHTGDNVIIAVLATGLIAVFFAPFRERLQRRVNRLMYGERDEPYAVLTRLGRQLEAALAPQAILGTIVETTSKALKLPYVAIALAGQESLTIAASAGTPVEHTLLLPLTYGGETVGQFLLARRAPDEDFTPADLRLLDDLARHTGIAVYAARLTTDLQRSRERLVTAREEERRRLRRDLHDGLGPTLASLSQRLNVAGTLVPRDPPAAVAMLHDLQVQVKGAITDIRSLVYALRPPTLDEYGLVNAIRQHASQYDGRGTLRVIVVAPEVLPPLPAAVEVAAYRIALEAMTNVTRHAHARICQVQLSADDALSLEITDDGMGLPTPYTPGVGMASMRERAEELGGTCRIESGPSAGTRVLARLPIGRE